MAALGQLVNKTRIGGKDQMTVIFAEKSKKNNVSNIVYDNQGRPHKETLHTHKLCLGEGDKKVSEINQKYVNGLEGVEKTSQERIIDNKAHKIVKTKKIGDTREDVKHYYKGMDENELVNFNKEFVDFKTNSFKSRNQLGQGTQQQQQQLGQGTQQQQLDQGTQQQQINQQQLAQGSQQSQLSQNAQCQQKGQGQQTQTQTPNQCQSSVTSNVCQSNINKKADTIEGKQSQKTEGPQIENIPVPLSYQQNIPHEQVSKTPDKLKESQTTSDVRRS